MLTLEQIGAFRCFEGVFYYDTTTTGGKDFVVLPPDMDRTSVQLKANGACVAVVEASVSTIDEVIAGNGIWRAWDKGSSTGGIVLQDTTTGPISAVRLNVTTSLSGSQATMWVKTQRNNP